MRVLVIGGGVVGLAAAWYLRADGHAVTVVERHSEVGMETSFANGGQLSYSYVAPLAGPGVLGKVPGWLLKADSPMRFRPRWDPDQWRWIARFILACNRRQSEASTRELLALSFFSRDLLHELLVSQPALADAFDFARSGKLVVYRSALGFDGARKTLDFQRSLGCEQEALDAAACLAREPALAAMAGRLAGGIYTESEECGDCHRFTLALAAMLRQRGVQFRFDTAVSLAPGPEGYIRAYAGAEHLACDHIVVAGGVHSVPLLKPVGIHVPLYPLNGYSLTLPITGGNGAPVVSVTDFENKVVYARIGERLRVAAMADLTGYDRAVDPRRIQTLVAQASEAFPHAGNFATAQTWCGSRPATPTGLPLIGATRHRNLWLNLGQGALGFTLALGSGRRLADLLRLA